MHNPRLLLPHVRRILAPTQTNSGWNQQSCCRCRRAGAAAWQRRRHMAIRRVWRRLHRPRRYVPVQRGGGDVEQGAHAQHSPRLRLCIHKGIDKMFILAFTQLEMIKCYSGTWWANCFCYNGRTDRVVGRGRSFPYIHKSEALWI